MQWIGQIQHKDLAANVRRQDFTLVLYMLTLYRPALYLGKLYLSVTDCVHITYITNNFISCYLILLRISPVCIIRKNWFSVVALWKYAVFSLTKNVSGTHIWLMYSAPTTNFSRPGLLNERRSSRQNWRKYISNVKSYTKYVRIFI